MHMKNNPKKPGQFKRPFIQTHLSRTWFLSKGCKQVPLEYSKNIVRWGHPGGYFLKPDGQKATDNFSPAAQRAMHDRNTKMGKGYPILRECAECCHRLMALAFYGSRPTYKDKNGKTYVGICHHLIPDALDYKPANLLCWLTREQHTEADRRQKELKKVLPDMHDLSYDEHRRLQDPRVTSKEQFDVELNQLRQHYGKA